MRSKFSIYGKIGINKNAFHKATTSISIDEIEINRIILFDKTSYGNKGLFKYYIGYRYKDGKDGNFSPLNIKRPQLSGYTKHFDANNKYINFLVTDKELLEKNKIKYGIRLKTYLRKNLIKKRCIIIDILVLK